MRKPGALLPARSGAKTSGKMGVYFTHHPANAFYAALMFQVQLKDPNVYIGTVEGYPELDIVFALLKKNQIKKACLMPFMSVAGDHAKNDMAGDEDTS